MKKNTFPIIDTHGHFSLKENFKLEEKRIPNKQINRFFSDMDSLRELVGFKNLLEENHSLDNYIQCLDKNNIEMAWIHQLSFKDVLGYEVLPNRAIAKAIEKYPNRIKGFASVDIRKGADAVKELEDAIIGLKLHGFKLNPNDYGGFSFRNKKKLYPLFEKCSELNLPVSIHTGLTPGTMFKMRTNYPLDLDDIAVDFPDLTIMVEHMGFPWHDLCYHMVARHKNMYITLTAIANILIHKNPRTFLIELLKMLGQIGSKKIIWGSDWTATPNIEEVLVYIKNVSVPLPMRLAMGAQKITREQKADILGGNALKILN